MALIQTSGKKQVDNSPTAATTFNAAANFTAGNTVIIDLVHFGAGGQRITAITVSGTSAVKDSEVTDLGASNNHSEVWRASNIAGGSSAVVITTGAAIGQYITCGFEERDDVGENPLDKIGSTTDTISAAPSVTSAAATNTPDQIVYAGFLDYIGTNWTSATPPTGYTETWEEFDGTTHEAGSGAYKVETTAGSKTATFATGASMSWIAAMATYRIAIGGNVLAYRFLGGSATSYTTGAFTTQASGGTMLVCVGRGTLSDHVLPTDNKSNTYTQYDSNRAYTAWPTSGTALYAKTSFAGGTGHTITVGMTTTNDEVTILAVECPGYTTIVDQQWNEDLTTSTNTSSSVTTTGAAMLVAFWWGADSNGELLPAVPADWTLLKHTSSLASNHVQGAVAYKRVTGAGTYSIVWTPSTAQAAQLRIVALSAGSVSTPTVTMPAGVVRHTEGGKRRNWDVSGWFNTRSKANDWFWRGWPVAAAATGAYTMPAAQGSYTLTGQAAGLRAGRIIAAAQGSYTLTGQAVTLLRKVTLVAVSGSYGLTGFSAATVAARRITAAQGTYALTGFTAGLVVGRRLAAAQGSYTITGNAVGIIAAHRIAAAQGSYSLTGFSAALIAARRITAAQGSYTLTGQDATLTYSAGARILVAAQGSYALTGFAAGLVAARRIAVAQGVYGITGFAAGTIAARKIAATQGVYALAGQAAGLLAARRISIGAGGYTLTGNSANLLAAYRLVGASGSYVLSGQATGLTYSPIVGSYQLPLVTGFYVLNGFAAGFSARFVVLGPRPGGPNDSGAPRATQSTGSRNPQSNTVRPSRANTTRPGSANTSRRSR